ncbi:MAG TPA: hypothetical protein VMR21_03060 [Vicinamibacteria bacterium]|nr:hypothetical protein [Vicinamibacteria bacterium]
MVGFASGTATLLGPARWITAWLRASAWSAWEDRAMIAVIVVYVAASFLFACLLTSLTRRSRWAPARLAVPGAATLCAGLSLWGWTNPAVYATVAGGTEGAQVEAGGAEFVFGPYPDPARIAELKKEGLTALISLQHPAVVPFEPQGIATEKAAARELGIEFIHAPMLPWVSSNEASLRTIREVAARGKGRYYVHCGLGRDRTNVVKRMLERAGGPTTAAAGTKAPGSFTARLAEGKKLMERGALKGLDTGIWLIPYPNRHELYGNMLAGQVAHVLVLLDPGNGQQAQWLEEIRTVLAEHAVPVTCEPLRRNSQAFYADAVAIAKTLPRPVVIVVPHTPPHPYGQPGQRLAQEWTGEPWDEGPVWPLQPVPADPVVRGDPAAAARRTPAAP